MHAEGHSPETGKQDISYVTMSYDKSPEVDQGLRESKCKGDGVSIEVLGDEGQPFNVNSEKASWHR